MEYIKATADMVDAVYNVLQTTIKTVYPKYYPKEVTDFFCRHHSREHVLEGIASGNMGVLAEGDAIVGTGCFDGNHITGVYVLPDYQKRGCGSRIMDFLEAEIAQKHGISILDASLPAACLYEHRGYKTVGHGVYELENDVKLVYEIMEKELNRKPDTSSDCCKSNAFSDCCIADKQMKSHREGTEMICRIRKWEATDAKDLAVALSNRKVLDNLRDGLPYPYTEKDGAYYISAMLSADEDETFAFAVTADDKVIGSIGVFRQGNIHRQTGELGYYIGEEYWGKGIMTEAVKQICEYVFEKSDIIRIFADPFAYNTASCRVLEKAGFRYEGTLRSNAVKNGKVVDMKMYSLLKTDVSGAVQRF